MNTKMYMFQFLNMSNILVYRDPF